MGREEREKERKGAHHGLVGKREKIKERGEGERDREAEVQEDREMSGREKEEEKEGQGVCGILPFKLTG